MLKKNIFSILLAAFILYLSLASSQTFEKVHVFKIPYFDKIVHFSMYFVLMSSIILENRKILKSLKSLFLISLIPLFYGILIEFMQGVFTVTRSASLFDAVADAAGILISVLLWLCIKPVLKDTIR